MESIRQGEVLRLEDRKIKILVLSKDFFNATGMIVASPLLESASEDALHIPVTYQNGKGTVLLEQMKSLDMRPRYFTSLGRISFEQIQNIADAVQSIFDYYPHSIL